MVDNNAIRCQLCPVQEKCDVVIKPYTEMCVGLLQIEIKELKRVPYHKTVWYCHRE